MAVSKARAHERQKGLSVLVDGFIQPLESLSTAFDLILIQGPLKIDTCKIPERRRTAQEDGAFVI